MGRQVWRVGSKVIVLMMSLAGESWSAETTFNLPICGERDSLVGQHPEKYSRHFTDWKLPSSIYYRIRDYEVFLSESAEAVRFSFPGQGRIERVHGVSCTYTATPSYPGQLLDYRDTSYAHVLLPGAQHGDRSQPVLEVLGYPEAMGWTQSFRPKRGSAKVEPAGLMPVSVMDRNT